jgi:hypothetical protein
MKVAPEHSEGERVTAGIHMIEGLFLNRVALNPGNITKGHSQFAVEIEAHPANSATPLTDEAAMPASKATDAPVLGAP